MERRPLIIINTDSYPTFCDNKCDNSECSKHISKAAHHRGGCKFSKLRGTDRCEGCIPKRRKKNEQG